MSNNEAILAAARKGYKVSETGDVYNPTGQRLRLVIKRGKGGVPYLAFGVSVLKRKRRLVTVHRYVAYTKFGAAILTPGVEVRHLNGDSTDNSWDNIDVGSRSQNQLDKHPKTRQRSAQIAGRTNSLPESVWDEIKKKHAEGLGHKELAEMYGTARSTMSYRLSTTAKRRVLPLIDN